MKRQISYFLTGLFFLSLLIFPVKLLAAPYFEGKVITLILGYPPGGGYDRTARILAKHLPKHIPGNPTMVVQYMPGATSMVAANFTYDQVKPDGLTISMLGRNLAFGQLLKVSGIKFDLTKFSWIGSPTAISNVLVIREDLPYKTIFDLMKSEKQIFLGGVSPVEINTQLALILNKFLGINIKVAEYRGGADIWLAIERKEIDGVCDAYDSVQIRIDRGQVRPLLRTRISQPGIENLPINEDLTTDPIGKKVMAMHGIVGGVGRFLVAPPKTPDDVMKILRDALAKVVNEDSEFKEDAKKIRLPLTYVSSEKCLEIMNFLFNQPEEIVKEFSKYVKF